MSFTALMLGLMVAQTGSRKVTYNNNTFVIDSPEGAFSVATNAVEGPTSWTSTTWKAKLGARTYNFTGSTMTVELRGKTSKLDFSPLAVTPKLWSPDQIAANKVAISSGRQSDRPDAISGWASQGTSLFVLLRWNDTSGRGWFEALVKFSTEDNPSDYTLVGRFKGLTTSHGAVSNMITRAGDMFAAMTVTEEGTGVATLSPVDSTTGFKAVGSKAGDAFFIPDSAYGVTKDTTAAGTTILSILETSNFNMHKAAEIRGDIDEFMQPSIVRYHFGGRIKLLNLISGSELPVPADAGVGATPAGVLMWLPKANPRAAALYSAVTFRTLARWSATGN